ncbi:MAG: DUF2207 domain-containing protein [Candidatus Doudnabacteria bacterium]
MKKFAAIFILLFMPLLVQAQLSGSAESATNIDVHIKVNTDSTINVKETIRYDFGNVAHHGIYRDIPVKYNTGLSAFNLRLSNIKVSDDQGVPQPFSVSGIGDNMEIKIGDPNVTIAGAHTYIITYDVKRAINFFSDHDELYWNTLGTDWKVPIGQTSATVELPSGIKEQDIQATCFIGAMGSSTLCNSEKAGEIINFTYTQPLQPGQGMTIVVGWPKGIVTPPGTLSKIKDFLTDNWGFVIPLLAFIFLLYYWNKKGRDPKDREVIIAEYGPPDNLSPIEVGAIIDGKVDNRDLTAEIIQLAVQGYLKITRIEEHSFAASLFASYDYQLDLLKPFDDLENSFDQQLLTGLFDGKQSVKTSDLKGSFSSKASQIMMDVYKNTVNKGYFSSNPTVIKSLFISVGLAVIVFSIVSAPYLGNVGLPPNFASVFSLILTGLLIIAFGYIMPRRTEKGVLVRDQIKGLQEYLSVAEADRIRFHNAPEKTPAVFEKLLPYAIVLKVEKEWAAQFENIYKQPPTWYGGVWGPQFSAIAFTHDLGNFGSVSAASFSTAASGGSGFSGGGVGGGGGGGGGGGW